LLAIIFNFTLVFMYVKNRATLQTIDLLVTRYDTPDMFESSDNIRSKVLALIDRDILASLGQPEDEAASPSPGEEDAPLMDSDEPEEPLIVEDADSSE
jgi:hypothetical protein